VLYFFDKFDVASPMYKDINIYLPTTDSGNILQTCNQKILLLFITLSLLYIYYWMRVSF